MTPPAKAALAVLVGGDLDQMPRLRRFKAAYPRVVIGALGRTGVWQARVPEESGETVVTRYLLKDLLDKLGELLGAPEWLAA